MKCCPRCQKTLIGKECECGFKLFDNNKKKTEMETISDVEEEEYCKPLSAEERRIRRKEGIQHVKKLVNALPRVFRNTHLWKKYGEINNE